MENQLSYSDLTSCTVIDDPTGDDRWMTEFRSDTIDLGNGSTVVLPGELKSIGVLVKEDTNQESYYYFDENGVRQKTTHEHYVEYWDAMEATQGMSRYSGPKVYYSRGGGDTKYYAGNSSVIHSEATQADEGRSEGGFSDIECDVTDNCDPVYWDTKVYQDFRFEKARRVERFTNLMEFLAKAKIALEAYPEGWLPKEQWKTKKAILDKLYLVWKRFNAARYLSNASCIKANNYSTVFMTKDQYAQVYQAFADLGIKGKKSK